MVDIFGFNSKLSNKRVKANGSELHGSCIHTNHETVTDVLPRVPLTTKTGGALLTKATPILTSGGLGHACGKIQAAGGGATADRTGFESCVSSRGVLLRCLGFHTDLLFRLNIGHRG